MWWHSSEGRPPRPSFSIVLVVAFQALLGLLILLLVGRGIRVEYFSDQAYPDPGTPQVIVTMSVTAVLWIVSATGLFNLRNWARRLSLILASIALLAGGLGVLFYKRHIGFDFTPQAFDLLLIVSIMVSGWWWTLFTRRKVREQFHQRSQ